MNGSGARLSLAAGAAAARGVESLLMPVVERLLATVTSENDAIQRREPVDYDDFNLRKSQGLLEINRLIPMLGEARGAPAAREAMSRLHAALEQNERLLRVQLGAARKISSLIAEAIHDGQSDGTYSANAWQDWN